MKILQPEYYDKFECLGDKCPFHCCQGWLILIDDETVKKYREYDGELGNTVSRVLTKYKDRGECISLDKNGQCPFLDEKELCEIVKQKGAHDLSGTCTSFPRTSLATVDDLERNLSMGCPHALQLLRKINRPLTFVEMEEGKDVDMRNGLDEEVIQSIQTDLFIRNRMIDYVQHPDYPLWFKLFMCHYTFTECKENYRNEDYRAIELKFGAGLDGIEIRKNYEKLSDYGSSNLEYKFMWIKKIADLLRWVIRTGVGRDRRRNDLVMETIHKRHDNLTFEQYALLIRTMKEHMMKEEYFFENQMVSLIFSELLISYGKDYIDNNLNILFVIFLLVKYYILLYAAEEGTITEEKEEVIISIVIRSFIHGKKKYMELIEMLNKSAFWENPLNVLMILYEKN